MFDRELNRRFSRRLSDEFNRAFRRRYSKWDEAKHPRDDAGQFSSAGHVGSKWTSLVEGFDWDAYEPFVFDGDQEIDVHESFLTYPGDAEIAARLESDETEVPDDPDDLRVSIGNAIDAILQEEFDRQKKEEEDSELEEWQQKRLQVRQAVEDVKTAAELGGWEFSIRHQSHSSHSQYIALERGDEYISVRVSDHFIPGGGGFNEGTGERYSEPDVNLVVDADGSVDLSDLEQAFIDAESGEA